MTQNITTAKENTENVKVFSPGELVVYPTHGVGEVVNVEENIIAGTKLQLYVLNFKQDKMTLKVPVSKANKIGLRDLCSAKQIDKAVTVLGGKPKAGRGMWSRRAAEYTAKINSGDVSLIAEVVRDLHKNVDDPDRSYSERVIYESAFKRLASEYSAVKREDAETSNEFLIKNIKKSKPKTEKAEDKLEEAAA